MENCFQSDPLLDERHDTPHMYITLDWTASKYLLCISKFYIQSLKC